MVEYCDVLARIAAIAEKSPSLSVFSDALEVLRTFKDVDPLAETAYNRYFREMAISYVGVSGSDAEAMADLVESYLMLDARSDFDAYMQAMEWDREPQKRFYRPRRAVLLPVVMDLQDLYDGMLSYYTYSCPPRTGKSTLGCFFISFNMGNNPLDSNLMSGFSDKLTASFHKEMLSLITDHDTYRFAKIFPDAVFKDKSMNDETISLVREGRFPTLTCRSMIGTLTGAVQVSLNGFLYCDDMIESYEEAISQTRIQKVYETYLSQLSDRKCNGARELHIGTRWVPNDIIGRLESLYAGDPRFRSRTIPALDSNGESNFEYPFGLGFSKEYYLDQRLKLVEAGLEDEWRAKYMADPIWKEGLLFGSEELSLFSELPTDDNGDPIEPDFKAAVVDTKTRGEDYCVMPIFHVYGNDHYLVDCICSDSNMDAITPRIPDMVERHGIDLLRFESNVAGGAIANEVRRECERRGLGVSITTKYSTENKETRIEADSGWIKQRCLFKADPKGEYAMFMRFLTSYCAKGRNKHDDVPDSLSLYKRFMSSRNLARVEAVQRLW